MVLRRQERRLINGLRLLVADRLRSHVEDAGFGVIDPDDDVGGHTVNFDEGSFGPALADSECQKPQTRMKMRLRYKSSSTHHQIRMIPPV